MNKKIKELLREKEQNKESKKLLDSIELTIDDKITLEMAPFFEKHTDIIESIKALNESNDYFGDEYQNIYSFTRFYLPDEFKEYIEHFKAWLDENHCATYDEKNDTLILCHGNDNILINDEGDIFQGHECIIGKAEYTNDDEQDETLRNELIEAYMDKAGFFPGVFFCNYHGNIYHVNTKQKLEE